MKLRFLTASISLALIAASTTPASASLLNWLKPTNGAASTTTATSAATSDLVREANSRSQAPLTYAQFKALAVELAPRVDLFRDVWRQQPGAEFFGGTTRDYLYWLKGQLNEAKTPEQLSNKLAELRARKEIRLDEFVAKGSDVDVVAKRDSFFVDADRYHVKRVDFVNIARFNPQHPVGETEVIQGFIPIEKIRLSQAAVYTDVQFGDGVRELFESKPTVHFASDADFERSYYAKLGINHPILLALRYIRVIAMDYKRTRGDETPTLREVLLSMDKTSHDQVTRIFQKSAKGELTTYLTNDKFVEWLSSALTKTTGTNTSAEVSSLLLEHFGVSDIVAKHPEIAPLMPRNLPKASCPSLFR